MSSPLLEKAAQFEARYEELSEKLSAQETLSSPILLQRTAKEHASLARLVQTFREYKSVTKQIDDNTELLRGEDTEVRELAQEELPDLERQQQALYEELRVLLLPKDPNDEKDIVLEIRAGTGGEEAALFVSDLFRMYARYAERRGWKVDIISSHATGSGGFKEIIGLVEGRDVYSHLKYESGVHRVQRVPETEAQGRIHTSAVTVAILPEAEEVDVEVDPKDLQIDVFRSSGPGGQSVNTTDSAVRITHLPTRLVVTCQDEKSQHKNKAKALRVLRARLLEAETKRREKERSASRRSQVGSGDRSEKIRTYNFPQSRVTEHRIGLTLHRLETVLDGDLDPILEPLTAHFQAEAVERSGEAKVTGSKGKSENRSGSSVR